MIQPLFQFVPWLFLAEAPWLFLAEAPWLFLAEAPWLFLAEDVVPEAAEAKPFILQLMENPLFPIAGIMLIFYLTLLAPERRRKAAEAKRIAGITKNDRVITSGGLHGTVVSAPGDSDVVTIRLDESGALKVKVSRWALSVIEEKKPKDDQ